LVAIPGIAKPAISTAPAKNRIAFAISLTPDRAASLRDVDYPGPSPYIARVACDGAARS
jgi:hypothetical protein